MSKSKRSRRRRQAPRTGYGFLAVVLDQIDDGPLLEALGPTAVTGRPGFSRRALLRLVLSKYVLGIRFNVELLVRLRGSRVFRQVCGFEERTPSESTVSRFVGRLAEHQELLEECFTALTAQQRGPLKGFGRVVAVDSTSVETFSNPNRKVISDPDAAWGVKNSSKTKEGKTEFFFGYKLHLLSDADYGLPLAFTMTPGNDNDSPVLKPLLEKADNTLPWLRFRYLLADRGYDAIDNHREVIRRKAIPVIHIKKSTSSDGLHNGIYTTMGSPTCLGMEEMDYICTNRKTGHHLFRCRPEGCELKAKHRGLHHCDTQVWEDPVKNLRIVGLLPRASPEWKRQYDKRMSIERIFRSLKHSRGLEGHLYRGLRKVLLHSTLSLLTYQATALARVKTGDLENLRMMRV